MCKIFHLENHLMQAKAVEKDEGHETHSFPLGDQIFMSFYIKTWFLYEIFRQEYEYLLYH